MEEVLTVYQAARYCNVPADTILGWIRSGHIRELRSPGGHRRIDRRSLEVFMGAQGIPVPESIPADARNRILVVDDDPIIVESIVQALEEDERDYEVISAADGFEADLQISHFKPHLLILDIMMPDIKGYEVCRKIKSSSETQDTKIIVLSAYLDDEKFKKMKEYGADVCFSKPLPLARLKEEVAGLLQTS
ncbi:MAG: response regulator [Desulfatiglandaceae bacterium]